MPLRAAYCLPVWSSQRLCQLHGRPLEVVGVKTKVRPSVRTSGSLVPGFLDILSVLEKLARGGSTVLFPSLSLKVTCFGGRGEQALFKFSSSLSNQNSSRQMTNTGMPSGAVWMRATETARCTRLCSRCPASERSLGGC